MQALPGIWQVWLCLALLALPGGCAGRSRDRIQSGDPKSRVRAIIRAAEGSDRQAVPLIVDRLDDEDEAVRVIAGMAVKRLTGQDFGYRPYDPIYRRRQAVERWRRWLEQDRIGRGTTRPKGTTLPKGEGQ